MENVAIEKGSDNNEFLERFESLLGRADYRDLLPPKGLCRSLYPYQVKGYSWLAGVTAVGFGACLADDMGLGKTMQTLAFLERQREMGQTGPTLVVCPTSVLLQTWRPDEVKEFASGLFVLQHHGVKRPRKRGEFFAAYGRADVVVTSYSLLARDSELFKSVHWAGMILDEAQYIKNPDSDQARTACAISAGCRIALTGTPVENNVGDLWSIMHFLNPGLLGSRQQFNDRFFQPIQERKDPAVQAELRRLISPFILRRMKTDPEIRGQLGGNLADIPKTRKLYCQLTTEQAELYAAELNNFKQTANDRRAVLFRLLTKLKQICNHPLQYDNDGTTIEERSGKLDVLSEIIFDIRAVDERALIFTQFHNTGLMLQRHLGRTFDAEVLFLNGGVSQRERKKMIERFQEAKNGPELFVINIRAGGTGLNLQRANHVIHFDRWWNPAVEDQATSRADRLGQERNVIVYKLICRGTVEERIDELIESKRGIAGGIVGDGKSLLAEFAKLSLEELRDLLRFRAP